MKVVTATADLRPACEHGGSVGFVPTMGALHAGHLSLVARARSECDLVVVSIFVNPAQFGPNEDLASYPRAIDADLDACERAGVDVVFAPSADEMYPHTVVTTVHVRGLAEVLEGAHRPGHFDGVCLVVAKLLNAVGPCRLYLGEKDAQQLRVLSRMVDDLGFPTDVVPCPTVREADGLAMSSRNVHLSPRDRQRAVVLYDALCEVRALVVDGETDPSRLLEAGRKVLEGDRAPDSVDYLEVVDPEHLMAVDRVTGGVLVCGAIRVGPTRLIDNLLAEPGTGRT